MAKKTRLRRGDRSDAKLVRGLDAMHVFMPIMLPNRADNEAFIQEQVDLTPIDEYLKQKNAQNPEHRYTLFHVVLAAMGRTIQMRPRMNRFIIGGRFYERNDISFSLIAKKAFSDDGDESIVILRYDPTSGKPAIDELKDKLCGFVHSLREEDKTDSTTDILTTLAKFPLFLRRLMVRFLRNRDENHGGLPFGLNDEDPYHSTVFITNLGSIRLRAGYHHLTNWGTNSIFVVVGERRDIPCYNEDGGVTMRPVLNIGLTLDERIADGYYYARTVKLFKQLMQQPELLDVPAKEALDIAY